MADIVERLRNLAKLRRVAPLHDNADVEAVWLEEAAELIERLRQPRSDTPVTDEMVERAKAAHDASVHWLWRDRWRDALTAALSPSPVST